MKLYTRTGDAGFTDLLGTRRVRKDDSRIEACGVVDELNCWLGHCLVEADRTGQQTIGEALGDVQADLFTLGARLAALGTGRPPRDLPLDAVERLEIRADTIGDGLPPVDHFVVPGGCELATRLHIARAVCRRAERTVVHLLNPRDENFVHDPLAVRYLNRLSDLLFAAARLVNVNAHMAEALWSAEAKR